MALAGPPSAAECDAASEADAEAVRLFLIRKQGILLTATDLEDYCNELGMARKRLRNAIRAARLLHLLTDQPLPKDQIHGQRKTYLQPAGEGAF